MTNQIGSRSAKAKSLRERVIAAKPFLPKNYKDLILDMIPEYKTMYGMNLLINVIALRSTDEKITLAMEQLAQKNKAA